MQRTPWNPLGGLRAGRLIAAGKLPKVAFVAFVRKLLTTLNALVRAKQPWNNSFHDA